MRARSTFNRDHPTIWLLFLQQLATNVTDWLYIGCTAKLIVLVCLKICIAAALDLEKILASYICFFYKYLSHGCFGCSCNSWQQTSPIHYMLAALLHLMLSSARTCALRLLQTYEKYRFPCCCLYMRIAAASDLEKISRHTLEYLFYFLGFVPWVIHLLQKFRVCAIPARNGVQGSIALCAQHPTS